jgi:hypothetical protein
LQVSVLCCLIAAKIQQCGGLALCLIFKLLKN